MRSTALTLFLSLAVMQGFFIFLLVAVLSRKLKCTLFYVPGYRAPDKALVASHSCTSCTFFGFLSASKISFRCETKDIGLDSSKMDHANTEAICCSGCVCSACRMRLFCMIGSFQRLKICLISKEIITF